MKLTDIVGKLARNTVLTAAVLATPNYNCGGGGNGCENDFDCREPRVCRNGECIDPNEGEAEAEGEGERIPWYEGMCEEYSMLRENGRSQDFEDIEYCQRMCEPTQSEAMRRECAVMYCKIEVENFDYKRNMRNPEFVKCMGSFGYTDLCDDPNCK